ARACQSDDLQQVAEAISAISSNDPWLTTAAATLASGSPGSVRLAFELHKKAAGLSLAEVFRLEYLVSLHCTAHGDFEEGVRALLIDKDRNPHSNPATLAEASQAWSEKFFAAPWSAPAHPLADLGGESNQRRKA